MKRNVFMDVKTFSSGDYYRLIRFRKAKLCRAGKVRQNAVHVTYRRNANRIDRLYNNWDRHRGPGPVENALTQYGDVEGLTVRAHGEGSTNILDLIDRFAERGAARRYRQLGYRKAIQARSVIKHNEGPNEMLSLEPQDVMTTKVVEPLSCRTSWLSLPRWLRGDSLSSRAS